ncbi:hypothetical protein J2S43_006340 [Catenuloplanes nepalensis]|uniref:Uncharacterized protein n=1 Tax=Catenuloplanes nepalensis TaxID=587533 RepID=A0ABT9N2A4_9ACTN|nr:hypothetical protein [Catenuloplanes nepalensis]MDP9797828.1 hypothetical protein [Catenuloplanes nepalensis]
MRLEQTAGIDLSADDVLIATKSAASFGVEPELVTALLATRRIGDAYLLTTQGDVVRKIVGSDTPWIIDVSDVSDDFAP